MTWNSNSSKLISSLVRLNIFSAHTKWQSWERRCLVEQWKSPPGKGVPGKHESIRSNFSPLFTWTCREYPLLSFIYHLLSGTHRFIDPWPLKIGQLTDSFLSEASKASMYGTVDAEVGTGTLHCCTTWGPMFSGCWVWFPGVGLSSIHRIPTPHGMHLLMRLMHHEFRCETTKAWVKTWGWPVCPRVY